MNEKKELYGRVKHNIKPAKSSRLIKWMKEENPNKEIHHLIGSTGKLKLTDYLVVAVTREEHARAEAFKILFFFEHIHEAINNLITYTQYLENK